VKDGQYDDGYTPSMRILFDEKKDGSKEKTTNTKPKDD
jgi:nitrogen fixation-related uncharacterized protein